MKTSKTLLTAGAVVAFSLSLAFGQSQQGSPGQQPPPQPGQQQQEPGQPPAGQQQDPSQQQPGLQTPPPPPGQSQAGQQQQQQQQQKLASQQGGSDVKKGSDISGKEVMSQDGQQLGQIDDLALKLESGELAFVLVAEQGGPESEASEWKPIPPEAIQIQGEEITASIDQQQWESVQSVSEQDIANLEQQAEQIYQSFGEDYQQHKQKVQSGGSGQGQQGGGQITLASKLMENELKNQQDEEIGKVTDVLLNHKEARVDFLLIEPSGESGEFAVAPQALKEQGEGEFQLNITQQDFQQAQAMKKEDVQQHAQQAQAQGQEARQNPQLFRYESGEQSAGIYGGREQRQESALQQRQSSDSEGAEIEVEQPAPQVRVQQPQPEVRVQQPAPEIRVQVEQPPPQVDVQQADPQVQVEQAQPKVRIEQSEPQVRVQQSEPRVQVQREGLPEVQVLREGEPQIQVERQQSQGAQPQYGQRERQTEEERRQQERRQQQQRQQQQQQR